RRLPVLAVGSDLRRHQRDPAQRDRRAHPRPPEERLMQFDFSQEQRLFQTTLRDFLRKECPPDRVRGLWESESGRSDALWRQLAELGLPGLLAPVARGGLGLDEVDLVLLMEEVGRAALAEPLVATAAVGVPLLAGLGGRLGRGAAGGAPGGAPLPGAQPRSPLLGRAHLADPPPAPRRGRPAPHPP